MIFPPPIPVALQWNTSTPALAGVMVSATALS
jgi:hypothetical protein